MKKNNGFTLIELLAVVVILALIMLIAGPIILDLIEDSQKGAFKNTAYGIIEAGKYNYTNEIIKSSDVKAMAFSYVDGVEISNPSGRKLDYKGDRPKTGAVLLNDEGQIAIAIHNGKFCASKSYTDAQATISEITEQECLQILNTDTSAASVPALATNMIPITWNGTTWIKADNNNMPGALEWYDYSAKKWANVALVSESQREMYNSAVAGTEVQEADVMAYLVWLPRYKYKIFNIGVGAVANNTIDIVFEDKTTPKSVGTTVGTYLTHPAFTYDGRELSGIWVGKYETSSDTSSSCYTAASATSCDVATISPRIKPNVYALRYQRASYQFSTAQKFNDSNLFGLTLTNDAHMMKNMEWGAAAYLSRSIYGKDSELWNNPNTSYKTGCAGTGISAINTTACDAYNTYNGQQTSTTGNIHGVYDMSGGSWERTMAAMYNVDGSTIMLSSSGFTQAAIDDPSMVKYLDKYTYGTSYSDYTRRKLGDATTETITWYGDRYRMVHSASLYSWFIRGYAVNATPSYEGPFAYYYNVGSNSVDVSFRTVILGD